MDTRGIPAPPQRPFFTFRSIAASFAVAVAAALVSGGLTHTRGAVGALTAAIFAVGWVAFFVAWAGGLVFAWRARSLFWFFAVCFLGPLGSVVCAWFVSSTSARAGRGRR